MKTNESTFARRYGLFVSLLVLAALAVGCRTGADANPGAASSEEPLGVAPDFTLPDMNGASVSLADYKGKRVLVNFWATWCPPCVAEMPDLVALYEANKDDGLVIIGISIRNTVEEVSAFAEEYDVRYPLLVGEDKEVYNLTRQFGGAEYIPTTYLVDEEGHLVRKLVGQHDRAAFERLLRELDSEKGTEEEGVAEGSPDAAADDPSN